MQDAPKLRLLPSPSDPVPSVVEMLEDMLQRARAGEIVAVAIVGITRDGSAMRFWEPNNRSIELVGGVSIMQNRLIADMQTTPIDAPPSA